ncbi:MAG: tetratricopeptide repeat protein [Sphingobium sp.]
MILPLAMMLMQTAAYPPETEAVMNRSRQEAQAQQKAAASARGLSLHMPADVALKLQTCVDEAIDDPNTGLQFAQDWAKDGGGFSAAQCTGFAHSRAERWDAAETAFEGAARMAETAGSEADAGRLWAQAGNAALAGGRAQQALGLFGRALSAGVPDGLAKGEILLDRARAHVALGDSPAARSDLDTALGMAADDPLAWLLSATLARRDGDLTRAAHDIDEAAKRSPDDPHILLEQGNIAVAAGNAAAGEAAWRKLLSVAPDSEPAASARQALTQFGAAATTTPKP